jgi:hypothetical protein
VALLRPRLTPHDRAAGVVGDRGQVAVMAPVADLVDADRDQPGEPVLVEVVGDDALNDRADRVPADPQQPSDRRERHLLCQPRDHVLEIARVARTGSGPGHRLEPDAAVAAAQAAQLALDDAAAGRCRQRLTRRSWTSSPRPVRPQPPQTRRRRLSRTVTITPSPVKLTSTTEAPGKRSSRLNAVTTRTSPSLQGRRI